VSSPPKDWDRWADLVRDLVQHLVDRYGRDEVRDHWAFEVWNEPNLEYFWSGEDADYLRLYDTAVRAVRSVDAGLRVGGPATAAVGWVEDLLAHTQKTGVPLDFVSTHLAGGLVEAWGSRDPGDGRVAVALWNVTLDRTKSTGEPALDRAVTLRVEGLTAAACELRHLQVDLERSNIAAVWEAMSGGAAWPDEDQWAALRRANRLEELAPPRLVGARGGVAELAFDLPMPSVSLVELVPVGGAAR
jgi:beta-xylosidase